MAAAMDSAVVFSSPSQRLRFGQPINFQGAVFLHDTKANMTGSYVAINPSFHARNPTTGYVAVACSSLRASPTQTNAMAGWQRPTWARRSSRSCADA